MTGKDDLRIIKVWDAPIRLFHWILVALITVLGVTGELGRLDVHMILGPGVIALILFRLIWGIIGSETARFSSFIRGPRAVFSYLSAARRGAVHSIGHNPLGAFSVLALLAVIGAQGVTGLFTSDDILTQGPLAHLLSGKQVSLVSSLHRIGFKLLLGLIALHLAATAFYRFVKKDDLIKAMITGDKSAPAQLPQPEMRNPLWAALSAALSAALVWGVLAAFPPPLF